MFTGLFFSHSVVSLSFFSGLPNTEFITFNLDLSILHVTERLLHKIAWHESTYKWKMCMQIPSNHSHLLYHDLSKCPSLTRTRFYLPFHIFWLKGPQELSHLLPGPNSHHSRTDHDSFFSQCHLKFGCLFFTLLSPSFIFSWDGEHILLTEMRTLMYPKVQYITMQCNCWPFKWDAKRQRRIYWIKNNVFDWKCTWRLVVSASKHKFNVIIEGLQQNSFFEQTKRQWSMKLSS